MNAKVGFPNAYVRQPQNLLTSQPDESISDHIPALIFVYDPGRDAIVYGNQRFTEFTGRSLPDLPGWESALASLVHHQDFRKLKNVADSVATSGKGALCIARLADQHGHFFYHRIEVRELRDTETSKAEGVLFMAHDITDVLKSKEEIETTREMLRETELLLQVGSWTWNIASNTVTWSPGLYSLLGYKSASVQDRINFDFYLDHIVGEYAQSVRTTILQAVAEKSDFSCEYPVKTKSGTIRNISTRGKLATNEQGEVIKVQCINRDVNALRTVEKAQERSIGEVNRPNGELDEFAYIASHDLQEPLRKISMFTERLKAKYENTLDDEGALFVDRILASASNMRTLIDDLLDFSRLNRRAKTNDHVDIKAIFAAVISDLEPKIQETHATVELSGTFPAIEAVPGEMKQLFGNIVLNAIKFRSHSASPEIHVRSSIVTGPEKAAFNLPDDVRFHKIEVQDNGIGFEPEYAQKIFQIFQRLNGKAEYPGSGIGLAICKKIVEKHNGVIFAKGLTDQGSTFTVILPEKQF